MTSRIPRAKCIFCERARERDQRSGIDCGSLVGDGIGAPSCVLDFCVTLFCNTLSCYLSLTLSFFGARQHEFCQVFCPRLWTVFGMRSGAGIVLSEASRLGARLRLWSQGGAQMLGMVRGERPAQGPSSLVILASVRELTVSVVGRLRVVEIRARAARSLAFFREPSTRTHNLRKSMLIGGWRSKSASVTRTTPSCARCFRCNTKVFL